MDSNATCYACDECGIPCELAALLPFKRQHICRICRDRLHAFTAPIEQVNAELRDAGIDPDEATRRVVDRLAEVGIRLPTSSAVPCPVAPRDPAGTAPATATADPGSRPGEP